MTSLVGIVLLSAAAIAQPGDWLPGLEPQQAAGRPRLPWLYGPHSQDRGASVPPVETFHVVSGRQALGQSFVAPVTAEAGTLMLTLQTQERLVPVELWSAPTFGRAAAIDQASLRLGAQWLDGRRLGLETAVNYRTSTVALSEPAATASIAAKATFARASDRVEPDGTSSFAGASASGITSSVGFTTREFRRGGRQNPGSPVASWHIESVRREWFRFGILVNYCLDVRDIDGFVFLEVWPRTPPH